MGSETDYRDVAVPADTAREKYTTHERRADILRRIMEHGQPWTLNKSELGRQYGVSHTTIGNDFDVLAECIEETLGNHHRFQTRSVLQRCIRGLLDEERWAEAARIQLKYADWLMDIGAVERAPEKREVDASVTGDEMSTDSYTIISDEGEVVDV